MGTLERLSALLEMSVGERPVDPAAVRDGLAAPEPHVREAAGRLAAGDPLAFAPELLRLWHEAPARRRALEAALATDPLLLFESRRPAEVGAAPLAAGANAAEAWFAPERVRAVLAAWPAPRRAGAQPAADALLATLRGLRQLLAASPHSPLPPA